MRAILQQRLEELRRESEAIDTRLAKIVAEGEAEKRAIARAVKELALLLEHAPSEGTLAPTAPDVRATSEVDEDEGDGDIMWQGDRRAHTPAEREEAARAILQALMPGQSIRAGELRQRIGVRVGGPLSREHFRAVKERLEPELVPDLKKGFWALKSAYYDRSLPIHPMRVIVDPT